MPPVENGEIYLKQIILISNKRDPIEKTLADKGFHVTWCPFELEHIIRVRDRSNVLFLCVNDEKEEDLNKICLYLRDMCIEEEKELIIYGKASGVDFISSRVPALFIRKKAYAYAVVLTDIINELLADANEDDIDLPGLLIVDDDTEYIAKLRPYLEPHFRIYICHEKLDELGAFISVSDIILINGDESYTLFELLDFFKTISARMRSSGLKFYYLTENDENRTRMNSGSERDAITLSKNVDAVKTASFIINSYKG